MSATLHLWNFNAFAYILVTNSRSVYRKIHFSLSSCIMREAHWRFLPEVSPACLSACDKSIKCGWGWSRMMICSIPIDVNSLHANYIEQRWFPMDNCDDFNKRKRGGLLINQTSTTARFTNTADGEIKTHMKKQNFARNSTFSPDDDLRARRYVKTKVGAT